MHLSRPGEAWSTSRFYSWYGTIRTWQSDREIQRVRPLSPLDWCGVFYFVRHAADNATSSVVLLFLLECVMQCCAVLGSLESPYYCWDRRAPCGDDVDFVVHLSSPPTAIGGREGLPRVGTAPAGGKARMKENPDRRIVGDLFKFNNPEIWIFCW
jgi:hypothetical protein